MKSDVSELVDRLFRKLSSQLIATLTRILGTGSIDLAENVVQESFLQACKSWPYKGIPPNPEGWLTLVAKNRAIDLIRKENRLKDRIPSLVDWSEAHNGESAANLESEDSIVDDQLRLIFIACHPCLSQQASVSLTLKVVGGFSVSEIARAFLKKEDAIRKQLTRSKQTIGSLDIPFELPQKAELAERIESVLAVIYLIFNEGYSTHEGDHAIRENVCQEAIRLSGVLLQKTFYGKESVAKIHALRSLMLLHASRSQGRIDGHGELLLLEEQDRSQWDRSLIAAGLEHLSLSAKGEQMSRYHLEARIAAAHATAVSFEATDWETVLTCYQQLEQLAKNPVATLNKAVALAMARSIETGLSELDAIADNASLKSYYLLPATYAELYRRDDQPALAISHFEKALSLTTNQPVRRLIERHLAACQTEEAANPTE